MANKITYTLGEGEKVVAEFNANNSSGFACFFKNINESSVVFTNRRIIAVTKLGTKICCFGKVSTMFKECLVNGLSGINGYTYQQSGGLCCGNKLFFINIGTVDGDKISFSPDIKSEDEAQAVLNKIAEISEQIVK